MIPERIIFVSRGIAVYKFTLEQARRPRGGVEVQLHSFFNIGARWGWAVNATPRPLYPRESPGTHCIGGWVGLRGGLDGCRISRPHWDSIPDLPAHSESLYRLSYRSSIIYILKLQNHITNIPTHLRASAPSSGSFDIVFGKVIKC